MSDIKRCMACNSTQAVYADPTACAGCGNENLWVEVPDEDFASPAPAVVQSLADVTAPAVVQSGKHKGRR